VTAPVISIQPATVTQLDRLAVVIGNAFAALEVSHYLIPDRPARRDILTRHLRQLVEHAYQYGRVHTDPDLRSAAVWFPVGLGNVPDIANYQQRRAAICGEHTNRFTVFEQAMHHHHPATPPHWHLALLAVQPGYQGHGYGSALLAHQHRQLATDRLPAFLEASSQASTRLYTRHGYQQLGEPYPIGPGGPAMYPMWRAAAPIA
jgi:GNAT superfamily N-acetyltransferase